MSDQPPKGPPAPGVGIPQPVQQIEDSDLVSDLDAPEPAPVEIVDPSQLEASSVVPRFRRDLSIKPGEQGGVFDVHDPVSGKTFSLYEFEVSISRLLDGRRRVSDLLQDGARLGIPVDLGGLQKFVRQLHRYGFLAAPGEDEIEGEDSAWAERESWDDSTRTLFQSGIRMMRMGRPAEARGYFEAILDSYPDHPEATEMIALIDSGHSLQAAPIGSTPVHTHGALPPAGFGDGGISPLSQGGRSLWPLVAMGSVVVIGAVAITYIVVTRTVTETPASDPAATVATAPAAPAPAPAPTPPEVAEAAEPAELAAAEPEPVEEAAPAEPPGEPRSGRVEARTRPILTRVKAGKGGTLVWKARANRKIVRGRVIAQIKRGRRIVRKVKAPATGTLERIHSGKRVKADSLLARIVGPQGWWIHGEIEGSAPVVDEPCTVVARDGEQRSVGTVVEVEAGENTHTVVVSLPGGKETRWVGQAKLGGLGLEMAP